jgi:hypothetical protein
VTDTPTTVSPGYVTLEVEWLGNINTFTDGDLVHLTVTIVDTGTFTLGVDPDVVTINLLPPSGTETELEWQYANWDEETLQTPAVGVIGRTGSGVFEVWVDMTDGQGKWVCDAVTTGAGQGRSDQQQWYVVQATTEGGG